MARHVERAILTERKAQGGRQRKKGRERGIEKRKWQMLSLPERIVEP